MKVNRNVLYKLIAEAMDDADFYIEKLAGLLSDASDIEHINSAVHHFEMLSPMMEPESVARLSALFLDRIFDLYDSLSYGGSDTKASEQEANELNQLRDQFLEIYREQSAIAYEDCIKRNTMATDAGIENEERPCKPPGKLPPEQFEKYAKSIVKASDNPGKDLLEIGYDFHSIFHKVFGFPPPTSKKFEMSDNEEELTLKTNVAGKEIEFEFWYELNPFREDDYIMEPWFRFETMHGYDGSVGLSSEGIINISDGPTFGDDEEVSKEQLPGALRSAMGIPWDADLPEWPELPKGQPPAEGSDIEGPDDPPYEGKRTLNRNFLFETINEVLREEEDEEGKEKTPLELLEDKLDGVLSTKEWGHYVQFFDFIDTFESSGLISEEEANDLREPIWKSVFVDKIYDADNFDDIVEAFNNQPNLPIEIKEDISHSIYYYGHFIMSDEWVLNYVLKRFGAKLEVYDPENLYEISGVDQDTLEKIKERLIEFGEEEDHFEVNPETGGLMFGLLAKPYVNFEKKIEEIFGATPAGDPFMAGGSFKTVSIQKNIKEPFRSPMVGKMVEGEVIFEWSPYDGYGLEITLTPIWKPGMPTTGDDYYGVWVSISKEGPNIGELEIGIQNYEDELADHKRVPNKNGTYGFTVDEMKEKIKEMTGIDLNEIN